MSRAKADLGNLSSSPAIRGCIDVVDGMTLSGWCIDLAQPLRPVTLELVCNDEVVGTVTPSTLRPDIMQAIGFSTKTGFRVVPGDIPSADMARIDAAIRQARHDGVEDFSEIFFIRSAESGHRLDYLFDLPLDHPMVDAWLSVFSSYLNVVSNNNHIVTRKSIELSLDRATIEPAKDDVQVIAYYLPQFHPFEQNNVWWGEGFTEWTNVAAAKPYFPGHNQPRVPADLGYYDLRIDDVHRKQVDLARSHGVTGFCYYYYWFSGTTMMTMPIERHRDLDLDLDFCLCWANENWSRRWDGSDAEVLMQQSQTSGDDKAFIESVLPYFKHPRYIKIDGAPLLLVYRVGLLDDSKAVVAHWKKRAREEGFPDLHVSMAQTFDDMNPYEFGMDSATEFPPHKTIAADRTKDVVPPDSPYVGTVFDYEEMVFNEIAKPDQVYPLYRTCMPSWDNTSRRGVKGNVFHNASPEVFEVWLSHLIMRARKVLPERQRLVFINAWNEWAEGAYLEPDRKHGHAYLRAVRNARSDVNAFLAEALAAGKGAGNGLVRRGAELVLRLRNANHHMRRLVQREEFWQPDLVAPVLPVPRNALSMRLVRQNSRAHIDHLNGHYFWPSPLVVSRTAPLSVAGWFFVPEIELGEHVPIFAAFSPVGGDRGGGKSEFIASITQRLSRKDVSKAVKLDPKIDLGFRAQFDLTQLPPGVYTLDILVGLRAGETAAYTINTAVKLLVG